MGTAIYIVQHKEMKKDQNQRMVKAVRPQPHNDSRTSEFQTIHVEVAKRSMDFIMIH